MEKHLTNQDWIMQVVDKMVESYNQRRQMGMEKEQAKQYVLENSCAGKRAIEFFLATLKQPVSTRVIL